MTDYVDLKVEKEITIDVDPKFDLEVDVKVEKDVYIDVKTNVDVDIQGNQADLFFDVEALGKDTYVELDFVVLTVEDELSSITGFATSSVA